MLKKWLGALVPILIVIVLAIGWLRFIHDPQVRRDARQHAADSVSLALGQAFKDSLALYVVQHVRDSLRDDSLARAARAIRTVILPAAAGKVDTVLAGVADTAVRRLLGEAVLAERRQWQAAADADSARIVTLLHRVSTLEDLVAQGGRAVDSLTTQLAKRRHDSRWSLGVGIGPSVGTKGFDPVTVQMGAHYRI